jgi:hypothetical protein
MKKGEPSFLFKTLPGHKIARLELGGAPGSLREKIFFAAGVEVFGYSKKGKQFLRFDTNLTEDIQNIYISGVDLFISGKNVYNHFEDCKDTDYFLCSDRINDVLCLPPERTEGLSPVLACQDCALRLLHGSELVYEVEVAGPPKCTTLYGAGQSTYAQFSLQGIKPIEYLMCMHICMGVEHMLNKHHVLTYDMYEHTERYVYREYYVYRTIIAFL